MTNRVNDNELKSVAGGTNVNQYENIPTLYENLEVDALYWLDDQVRNVSYEVKFLQITFNPIMRANTVSFLNGITDIIETIDVPDESRVLFYKKTGTITI